MNIEKRVLIFSLAYCPFVGGAELAVKEITDRVPSKEITFHMITLRFDRRLPRVEKIGNIMVYRVGFSKEDPSPQELLRFPMYLTKIAYPLVAFYKAMVLHRKYRYDAVWSLMAYAGFPAVLFKLLYRNIPLALTLQEGDSVSHMTKRLRIRLVFPLYRMVFMKARVVQAISAYLAQFARSMGARCPIEVIPNGVDLERFRFSLPDSQKTKLRRQLGIEDTDKVLITASRLVKKNALDVVIDAMRYLPNEVKFLILGAGPLKEALQRRTLDYKLQTRIKFLGHVAPAKLPEYLQVADVFVRPSRSEGMGSAFIEAMAVGVPVVATAVGGIVDFLRDKDTGMFCHVDDPEHLAKVVKILLTDDTLRSHIIRNARELVREKYDWNIIVRSVREKVFGRLLEVKETR
jgi:glycosyltransferase involved in cell wall biosynthesis